MAMPERETALLIAHDLIQFGLIRGVDVKKVAHVIAGKLETRKPLRGLKDHELSEIVNATRDSVAPVCDSPQLRSRIVMGMTAKMREMGLLWDHQGQWGYRPKTEQEAAT